MSARITAMYFSPTHTTGRIVTRFSHTLSSKLSINVQEISLTLPPSRDRSYTFGSGDILVFGFPVYGGRVPKILETTLKNIRSNGAIAIILAVYGNCAYEDALVEANDLLVANGFLVVSAGAFIGEHSFTPNVGTNRPDEEDFRTASEFAELMAVRILKNRIKQIEVDGHRPIKKRNPALHVAPKTTSSCTKCMLCSNNCPAGVIGTKSPVVIAAGCIYCFSCVKICPVHAKYFDDPAILNSIQWLEQNFVQRREPEMFI